MKKQLQWIIPIFCICLLACNNGKETPESIAKEWCDLNSKVAKATSEEDRAKAEEARRNYERTIEEKYKEDTTMRRRVMEEVEKCEDESEGRK